MTYEYRCKILRIVDGDTVDVDIDLGFGIWIHKERVRIVGIDTPESRTKNAEEKIATFAGPPEYLPAITIAKSINNCPSPIRVASTPNKINKKTY